MQIEHLHETKVLDVIDNSGMLGIKLDYAYLDLVAFLFIILQWSN